MREKQAERRPAEAVSYTVRGENGKPASDLNGNICIGGCRLRSAQARLDEEKDVSETLRFELQGARLVHDRDNAYLLNKIAALEARAAALRDGLDRFEEVSDLDELRSLIATIRGHDDDARVAVANVDTLPARASEAITD